MIYVVATIVSVSAFFGGILFGYGVGRERGEMDGFAKGVKRGATDKHL